MVKKKEKKSIFSELLESVSDYRRFLRVFSKDLIFLLFIIFLFIIYTLILNKAMPANPGLTPDNIMSASQETLDTATASLAFFYNTFIASSIIGVIIAILALNFTLEWVWSGLNRQKLSIKHQPKFLLINLIIYIVASVIALGIMFLSGIPMQWLASFGASMWILQIIALVILAMLIPFTLHLINFSSYTFIKTRRFGSSLLKPFSSLGKIRYLLLPYLFILVIFAVIGLTGNYFIYSSINPMASLIIGFLVLVALILFLSWEKVYSFLVFERLYK